MKILILNYEFPPLGGGASPVSYEIAKAYVRQGHLVSVVTMAFKDLAREERLEGMKIYRVPCWRSKKNICHPHEQASFLLNGWRFFSQHLKNHTYDICHTHFIIPTGILAAWLKIKYKLPFIITAHGSDIPGYNTDRFQFLHLFTPPVIKWVLRHCSQLVAPSNFYLELAEQSIGNWRHKSQVIRNGIHLANYQPQAKKQIILSTGRLLRRKGFQYLIQAVSDIKSPYELHIVGDGPMRKELEQLAKSSKTKVVFHGWLNNQSPTYLNLLAKAAIFSFVSLRENASISLLEAMASGCAVITSNVTGCPETVGDAGIVIEPENALLLRQTLLQLIENPSEIQRLGNVSLRRVSKEFDWLVLTKKYETVLRQYCEV